jgi:hypothetical protein
MSLIPRLALKSTICFPQGEGRVGMETAKHRAGPCVMRESESGLGRLGTKINILKMAEGAGFDLNEIFRLDVTDDLAELDILDTEINEDSLEEPDSSFKNVSKGEFIAVLTRIRDRECNILDEAIFY